MSQAGLAGTKGGSTLLNTLTGNTGGAVSPSGGNINILGAGAITVTGSPSTHTLTITSSFQGLTWNSVSSSQAMLTNNGYITTGSSAITLTMPSLASVGDGLAVMVNGTGTVTIQTAGSGQTIRINNGTQGASGQFLSSNQGCALLFVCVVLSSSSTTGTWQAMGAVGTWNPN